MHRARAAGSSAGCSADMPEVAIAAQTRLFLMSFGFGFLLGVVYDLFRIARLTVTRGKAAVFVMDVLYFFLAGIAVFIFMLAFNSGEIRFYLLLGIVLGFLIYYFTFGAFILKWSNRIIRALRRLLRFLFRVISAPPRAVFRLLRRLGGKIRARLPARLKNFKLKSKIVLKQ